ncbi:MAG: ribokinase [Clostridia bacterium]
MKNILVIGSLNVDFVMDVSHIPVVGETILAKHMELVPGGKGANQAYSIGRMGGPVTMLGMVGTDSYGQLLLDSLAAVNVGLAHVERRAEANTGIALVHLNEEGDNCITVVPGANHCVNRAYIDAHIAALEGCDIVLLQLEIPYDTVLYAARRAKELGKLVILDPAPASPELPPELYAYVDIIKPNETELCILTGDPQAPEHLPQAADVLLQRGVKQVVVTLGKDGVYLKDAQGVEMRARGKENKKPVDTTAAGDSFSGAMAYALLEGKDIGEALQFAIRVSEIVITRKGAQPSMPTMEEILACQP